MPNPIATQLPPLAATVAPLAGEVAEALATIAQMGYRAAQLSATHVGTRPRDLDGSGRRGLASHLRRLGLSCAGFDLFVPPAHFIDSAFVDRAVDAVSQCATLAAAVGRCPVSIALPEKTAENESRLREVREAISACAQREGVWVADHGLDAVMGAAPMSSASALGIGIDPPTILAAGKELCEVVARCGSQVVTARIVDLLRSGMRGPPEEPHESRLDLLAYAASLAVLPLRFSPVADARQWTDPLLGLAQTLQRWTADPH
ncbi:MAG: hypothetical protein EXS17_05495 [Phycisphaerales bacterium]|nr:hypothetical protein [Phycisphaerales bacterium]